MHGERQEAGEERSRDDEGEKETKHWGKGLEKEKAVSEVTGAIKKRSSHSRSAVLTVDSEGQFRCWKLYASKKHWPGWFP